VTALVVEWSIGLVAVVGWLGGACISATFSNPFLVLNLFQGFPGSVSSLWQQAGRAGRREQASLSIVICFDGPLDQYFVRHPDDLFGRPIEAVHVSIWAWLGLAWLVRFIHPPEHHLLLHQPQPLPLTPPRQIDPANARLLRQHLACAAAELPLLPVEDGAIFGNAPLAEACGDLVAAGLLSHGPRAGSLAGPSSSAPGYGAGASLHYCGAGRSPAPLISLRVIDPDKFSVYDAASNTLLEEVEANKVRLGLRKGLRRLRGHVRVAVCVFRLV
jgi:DEAD/DEAH box helicase domain-containing protein